MDHEPFGFGADWNYTHSEVLEDSEVHASDSRIEELGLADPVKRAGSKWRNVEPPFTITYENGSWVLFLGKQ